jgi:hypothetical protein
MSNERKKWVSDKLLAATCAAVLCGILMAGLWPFTPHPKNHVAWLANGNGLHFGEYGTILSSSAFQPADSAGWAPCSLEIWAQPGLTEDTNTLLGFYSSENLVSFSMHQSIKDLVFQRGYRDRQQRLRVVKINIDDVFRQDRQAFITITSSTQGTAIYIDGVLVKTSTHLGLSSRDFAGQLVVANSPVANDSWSGRLRGLAIFDRELTAAEVLQHFNTWTKSGQPEISGKEDPLALYLFEERAGNVVHNHVASAPNLYIPDHYLILHQVFLELPWKEFHAGWGYYKNLIINIGGFVPLGFVFCAYFSSVRHYKRAQFITILLGATVSLTIEVLQAYIPTRDSGMTDVITNTLGTALGAPLYGWKAVQSVLEMAGFPVRCEDKQSLH